jgi:FlaA1/EpsC-like NDP-sugar epimerase
MHILICDGGERSNLLYFCGFVDGRVALPWTLTASAFLSKTEGVYSRGVFLCSGALVALIAPLHRAALRRLFAGKPWRGVPVLILGAGKTARALIADLRTRPSAGLKPVACLDDDIRKLGQCAGVPVAGPLSLAPDLARALGIRHAIVAMPGVEAQRLVSILERWGASFSNVTPHSCIRVRSCAKNPTHSPVPRPG